MLEKIQRGSSVYAVLEIGDPDVVIDSVSMSMINNNQSKKSGLAPVIFEREDDGCRLLFDITGRTTLRSYIGYNFTQESFKKMILELVNAIEGFEEYMIDVNQVLLDPDCVYINQTDGTVSFLCMIINGFVNPDGLYAFFREVITNCFVEVNRGGISYSDCVRSVIKSRDSFSLSNIRASLSSENNSYAENGSSVEEKRIIRENPKEKIAEDPETITVSSVPKPEIKAVTVTENETKEKKSLFSGIFASKKSSSDNGAPSKSSLKREKKEKREKPDRKKDNASSDSFKSGLAGLKVSGFKSGIQQVAEKTAETADQIQQTPDDFSKPAEVIADNNVPVPDSKVMRTVMIKNTSDLKESAAYLIRSATGQKMQLDRNEIRIGKESRGLDIDLSDNEHISHHHADIIKRSDIFYLIDNNSLNHTYLNDTMLKSEREYQLFSGDIIKFADEEFEFEIIG